MQIMDDVVSLAINAARKHAREVMGVACEIEPETMRAALEAAWRRHEITQKYAPPLDNSLRKCIEDLAAALKENKFIATAGPLTTDGYKNALERVKERAHSTLERWGLK